MAARATSICDIGSQPGAREDKVTHVTISSPSPGGGRGELFPAAARLTKTVSADAETSTRDARATPPYSRRRSCLLSSTPSQLGAEIFLAQSCRF